MKISKETIEVLKNFATINSNIIIKPGNVLKTVAPQKNILAEVEIAENFNREVGIWDLNKFLGAVSLFKDPDFDFQENSVIISSGGSSLTYFYADSSLLTPVPEKFTMPDAETRFDLNEAHLNEMFRASGVLKIPDLVVEGRKDGVYMSVSEKRSDTSNTFNIKVSESNGPCFSAGMKIEYLKLMDGDYHVAMSSKKISQFTHAKKKLVYYIALNPDSKWIKA